jgi:hypothetical protein
VEIDHVVWTTRDLPATEAMLGMRYDLKASGGGSHAGHGTHNRIFPLGGGFLEVVAVEDPELARTSPIGRGVMNAPDGLHTWVIAVADAHAQALRLGLDELVLRRGVLSMPLAGVSRSFNDDPSLPFFIERPAGTPIPGSEGADGGIALIEISCEDEEVERWLDGVQLPVECSPGSDRRVLSVTLESGKVLTTP